MKLLKKIVFWTYSRTSWQWDVLCVLILDFIFLTPKSWFANTSYQRSHAPQTVMVGVDLIGAQLDNAEIERRARAKSGREGAVSNIRPQFDPSGKLIGYEVDIR